MVERSTFLGKVRVRVAKLHTDQTVGSFVTNASLSVVTVSGVTWTSTCLFSFLWVWVIGGVGSLSTESPSGRDSGYLGEMYSQAPVRSCTKDRAGLVKNRNSSCGNLCRPHWSQVVAYHCLSVLCGGKGTALGCAPRGSPKVPSGTKFGHYLFRGYINGRAVSNCKLSGSHPRS